MKWLDECPTSRRNGIQEVQGSGVAADRTPLYMQGIQKMEGVENGNRTDACI